MIESDVRLLDRLRDLHGSLAADIAWLVESAENELGRPDVLRDLGERLTELGTDVLARSDELNAAVLATLPSHGWLPEAGARRRAMTLAHQVGRRPLRCGPIYLSVCGAACFPFYGTDPTGRTARHAKCPKCRERTSCS
ncbi:hypothetical protein [Amycolatopsis sp. NPDC059021]|uniref:hypothetical protein n=1 Tax=Amycolatopsis sp. NPDC059021 TaxID=3346704 RepID=UPI003672D0FC